MFVLDECDKMLDETGKYSTTEVYILTIYTHKIYFYAQCRYESLSVEDLYEWKFTEISDDVFSYDFR